jgi:hypothetical protein
VTKVNIFKLVDETSLQGWQSGLSSPATRRSSPPRRSRTSWADGRLCPTGTLPTSSQRAIAEAERETGLPATDPVRFGVGPLVDALGLTNRTGVR